MLSRRRERRDFRHHTARANQKKSHLTCPNMDLTCDTDRRYLVLHPVLQRGPSLGGLCSTPVTTLSLTHSNTNSRLNQGLNVTVLSIAPSGGRGHLRAMSNAARQPLERKPWTLYNITRNMFIMSNNRGPLRCPAWEGRSPYAYNGGHLSKLIHKRCKTYVRPVRERGTCDRLESS